MESIDSLNNSLKHYARDSKFDYSEAHAKYSLKNHNPTIVNGEQEVFSLNEPAIADYPKTKIYVDRVIAKKGLSLGEYWNIYIEMINLYYEKMEKFRPLIKTLGFANGNLLMETEKYYDYYELRLFAKVYDE